MMHHKNISNINNINMDELHYLIYESEDGEYQDAQGNRFGVIEGQYIYQPDKEVNEGCEVFENLDECLKAHGLTPMETTF